MRYSSYFAPTKKSVAKSDSINAHLLTKAGFVSQVAAGVYSLLPLGLRSIRKIEQIVREEMNAIGGNEVSLTALQPKSTWEKSGRWNDPNFRGILYYDTESDMALAPTHEEPITILAKESIQSYRDLPALLYQFQTKFRKELRAKSGLLRGREFRMKDLYSFHLDEKTHNEFYEEIAEAYLKAFKRLSLDAYRVKASGGVFTTQISDEFQVICKTGEDEILVDHTTKTGYNKDIEGTLEEAQKEKLERVNGIEVGNIFHYGTKYSDAFDLTVLQANGERTAVVMGAYGIGITRLLGTLAEIYNDENGLKLPKEVAPYSVYLIDLTDGKEGEAWEQKLTTAGYEVLYDDRKLGAGEKFVESDLLGMPLRIVISPKTLAQEEVEIRHRADGKIEMVKSAELLKYLEQILH